MIGLLQDQPLGTGDLGLGQQTALVILCSGQPQDTLLSRAKNTKGAGVMTSPWMLSCSRCSTSLSAEASTFVTQQTHMVSVACSGSVQELWSYFVRKKGANIALVSTWMHAKPRALRNIGTGAPNGRSKQLLGDFVRSYPGSAEVQGNIRIATKLAPTHGE